LRSSAHSTGIRNAMITSGGHSEVELQATLNLLQIGAKMYKAAPLAWFQCVHIQLVGCVYTSSYKAVRDVGEQASKGIEPRPFCATRFASYIKMARRSSESAATNASALGR
jgi:hypothetical protein